MTQSVSAMEARKKFGELLNRVSLLREEITIERAGRKIARLLPIEQQTQECHGKMDFRKAAGLGKKVWKGIDANAYVRRERGEWD